MKKGFTCECGEFHAFGVWVAAHYRDRLVHTCEKCNRKHSIWRGIVVLMRDNTSKRKKS